MHSHTSHRYINVIASAVFLVAFMAVMLVGPSAAFAAKECRRVAPGEKSMWERRDSFTSQCLELVNGTNGFVLIEGASGVFNGGWECVRVEPREPSAYSDNRCTVRRAGTGEFALVVGRGRPQFVTLSGAKLLFTATGGLAVLFGKKLSQIGEIHCEKSTAHGFILNASPLADEIKISFSGDCLENAPGIGLNKAACTEPINVEESRGELGITEFKGEKEIVGLDLEPVNTNKHFATTVCGGSRTEVGGAIIGIFPETTKYNKLESSAALDFEGTEAKQEPTAIELLGVSMTGVHLTVSEIFGEEAAEITNSTVVPDGKVEIRTP